VTGRAGDAGAFTEVPREVMTALAAEAHDVRCFDVGYTPDRRVLARARENRETTVRDGLFAVDSRHRLAELAATRCLRGAHGEVLPARDARPCQQMRTFTPRAPMHKYTDRPLTRWTILGARQCEAPVDNRARTRRYGRPSASTPHPRGHADQADLARHDQSAHHHSREPRCPNFSANAEDRP
jgi:hypothetical protein